MSQEAVVTQADLGRRIADARTEAGMTQADLAIGIGLERTALVRIESGERKVSATELVTIAGVLDRPVDWFFTEPPVAVISRRRDPAVGGFSRILDRALEIAARDVAFLEGRHLLLSAERPACKNLGVAVINGTTDPGRRRFSLAHELGHHLTGDAYEPSVRLGLSDTERMFNAFAAYLLMPRSSVLSIWDEFSAQPPRLAAIAVAVQFSVSWTAACNQLRNLDLIDSRERERLLENDLRRGELFEFGERFAVELDPPSVPPAYARTVVGAYRRGQLTAARTVELLHHSVGETDLPERDAMSLDELRGEFETGL
jgi:transcriptional regulator with XRE-family HTH domain